MPVDTRASNATKRPGIIAKTGTRRSSAVVAKEKDNKAREKAEKKQVKLDMELAKARRLEEVTMDATVNDAAYTTPIPQKVIASRKLPRRVLQRTESVANLFEDTEGATNDAASMPPPRALPNLKRKSPAAGSVAAKGTARLLSMLGGDVVNTAALKQPKTVLAGSKGNTGPAQLTSGSAQCQTTPMAPPVTPHTTSNPAKDAKPNAPIRPKPQPKRKPHVDEEIMADTEVERGRRDRAKLDNHIHPTLSVVPAMIGVTDIHALPAALRAPLPAGRARASTGPAESEAAGRSAPNHSTQSQKTIWSHRHRWKKIQ